MKAWLAGISRWLSIERFEISTSGAGFLIPAFLIVALLFVVVGKAYDALNHRKTTPVIATIKSFGLGGKYYPGNTVVRAQDDRGLTGLVSVPSYQLLGCKVGDKIRAERYGIALTLEPAPCPIVLKPGEGGAVLAK